MRGELVITADELRTRFQGERDLVTYSPYQIGDRVVRCSCCRSVIKTEFVLAGVCPLCGQRPFVPAPVINEDRHHMDEAHYAVHYRSLTCYLVLLILSAGLSLAPLYFPNLYELFYEATFNIGLQNCRIAAGIISSLAAVILYCSDQCRLIWRRSRFGWALLLIPMAVPYITVLAIWAVIFIVSFIIAGFLCALGVAIVFGFIAAIVS